MSGCSGHASFASCGVMGRFGTTSGLVVGIAGLVGILIVIVRTLLAVGLRGDLERGTRAGLLAILRARAGGKEPDAAQDGLVRHH
jgi:hypothetical protein